MTEQLDAHRVRVIDRAFSGTDVVVLCDSPMAGVDQKRPTKMGIGAEFGVVVRCSGVHVWSAGADQGGAVSSRAVAVG